MLATLIAFLFAILPVHLPDVAGIEKAAFTRFSTNATSGGGGGGGGGTCPQGSSYPDGCSSAPTGATIQYPTLLSSYAHRPPWNVAGVDYGVGMPPGNTLTSWASIPTGGTCAFGNPCVVVDTSGGQIRCNGGDLVLDKYDFTTVNAVTPYFYVPDQGCTSITITNSKFGCSTGAGGADTAGFAGFNVQNAGFTWVFKYNTLDFTNCKGNQAGAGSYGLYGPGGSIDFEYNYLKNIFNDVVGFGGTNATLVYKYNVIENPATSSPGDPYGVHENALSGGSGNELSFDASYNTIFSSQSYVGGEFLQIYFNGGGTITSPNVSNNTFPFNASGTANNLIHGSNGYSGPATTVTNGVVSNNYFDPTGSTPFYANSLTSALGWTSTAGNTDMVNGKTISAVDNSESP